MASRKNNRLPDRYQAFVDGDIKMSDLDDEEILKGQIRNVNGSFGGKPPLVIPREFHVQMVKELIHRNDRRILPRLEEAQDVIRDIMLNPRAPAIARLAAATYTWERIAGKMPEKMQVDTVVRKFEGLINDGTLLIDLPDPKAIESKDQRDIVDAEVVMDVEGSTEDKPAKVSAIHRKRRRADG